LTALMEDDVTDLVVRVKEIKGHCPVYKVGDTFALESGYRLVTEIPALYAFSRVFAAAL